MKRLLLPEVPAPAAAVVVALALIAGVVTGREGAVPPSAAVSVPAPAAVRASEQDDLDMSRLDRAPTAAAARDLFAGPRPPPPPAPPPARRVEAEPQAPVAPPLPYRYLGRMVKAEGAIVYLVRDQGMRVARAGDTLDGMYRVDAITESAVRFTYLQMGTTQTLAIPAAQ
jgi:hypothetical protein